MWQKELEENSSHGRLGHLTTKSTRSKEPTPSSNHPPHFAVGLLIRHLMNWF